VKKIVLYISFLIVILLYGCTHTNEKEMDELKDFVDDRYGEDFEVKALELVDVTPSGALWGVMDWLYEIKLNEEPKFVFYHIGNPAYISNEVSHMDSEYLSAYYTPQIQKILSPEIELILDEEMDFEIYIDTYNALQIPREEFETLHFNDLKSIDYFLKDNLTFPFKLKILLIIPLQNENYNDQIVHDLVKKLVSKLKSINMKKELIDEITLEIEYIEPSEKKTIKNTLIKSYNNYILHPELNYYRSNYIELKEEHDETSNKN
jgi:hypothetical protein